MSFYDSLQSSFEGISLNQLALRGFLAFAIIMIGFLLGKLIDAFLRNTLKKLDVHKYIRGAFSELFLLVVRWSIYIIFINMGLNQLELPFLSDFFSSVLVTIPAFAGALLLLGIGIGLAHYLKIIIKNSEIKEETFMSQIIFYFVIIIFGIYALKIALIPLDQITSNAIIISLTSIAMAGITYYNVNKELKKH